MYANNLKSKVFRKYVFSYTIMLCLPICIFCVTVYNSIKSDMRQKNITGYNFESTQIANQLDNVFIQYSKIRNDLMISSWVTRFMSDTDVFDSEFTVLKRNDICRELMIFQSLNLEIDNIAVYFPNKDTVFDQIGWFKLNDFLKRLHLQNISVASLLSAADSSDNFNYFDVSTVPDIPEDTIIITQKLELSSNPRATLLLFINKNYLDKYIDSISSSFLAGYSISGNNGLLIERAYTGILNEQDICQIPLYSDQYLFNYNFIYRIDTTSPNFEALSFVFIATTISLTIGSLIAYSLAYVNYTPIKKIVRKIFSGTESNEKTNEHEYTFIDRTFDNLFVEKNKMQMQVISYQNAARSDMMNRLLAGYFEQDATDLKMSEIGLNYTDELYYMVILLAKDKYQNRAGSKNSDMFALYNISDRILEAMELCYQIVVSVDGSIIIILDFTSTDQNKKICETLHEAFTNAKTTLPFRPKIFFGNTEKGIVGISKSFQKAKEEQNNSILKSNIVQTNLLTNKGLTYYYPTDWEIQLINKIKIGDYTTAKKILDEIKLENENRSCKGASIIKLTTDIIDTMTRILNELNVDIIDIEKQKQELLFLQETENTQLLWDFTYLVCSEICKRTADVLDTFDDVNLPKRIIEYINNNITDSNLSLKKLGDKFNLSVSSISKIFKDNMNINFYDYICRIRMDKAKEMLYANKYSIPKIAKAVGYENDYSFKRAFFRYEGVKPQEYKKIVISQKG